MAGELIITSIASTNTLPSLSVDSSFSILDTATGYSYSSDAYLIDPSASPINPTWSVTPSQTLVANIVGFLPL
jgi:expansin (peptidoglycan-binding protein)